MTTTCWCLLHWVWMYVLTTSTTTICILNSKYCLYISRTDCNQKLLVLVHSLTNSNLYFAPRMNAKYCDEYVIVCLSVHSHNSKTTWSNFTKFSMHVTFGSLWYVNYFWFCGWRHIFIPRDQSVRIKHGYYISKKSAM